MSTAVINSLIKLAMSSPMSNRHASAIVYKKHHIISSGCNYPSSSGLCSYKKCLQAGNHQRGKRSNQDGKLRRRLDKYQFYLSR